MARQKFAKDFNTFVRGLITEASQLTFPDDASLDERNFVLDKDGGRRRRFGMELQGGLINTFPRYSVTSTVYPIESIEESEAHPPLAREAPAPYYFDASEAGPVTILSGFFREPLVEVFMEEESTDSNSPTIIDGYLREPLITYVAPVEATDAAPIVILSGVLRVNLVAYPDYQPEATDAASPNIIAGSLT